MHFLTSSLTLLAYSDCVEGRWHLRHKVTMRVTHTPSTETISVGKMLSGKWDFPFSKTGCRSWGLSSSQRSRRDNSFLRAWSVNREACQPVRETIQ